MDVTLPYEGVGIRDAVSQTLNPLSVPDETTSVAEALARMYEDQLNLLTGRINDLERSQEEAKTRADEAEQRNKALQQALDLARINDAKVQTILDNLCIENRTLKAEVRRHNCQGKDIAETSRRVPR